MESALTRRLHELVWLMDVVADQRLKDEFGISYAKFVPLALLIDLEPTTQHNLAVHLRQTDAAVSRSLAVLKREGLVAVDVSAAHARRNEVRLTAVGRRLATRCGDMLEGLFQQAVARSGIDAELYQAATGELITAVRSDYEDRR